MTKVSSIISKLKKLSKESNTTMQMILFRYFHEGLLYRVSQSRFSANFILKGGNLIYAITGLVARPTVDVDFMGAQHSNVPEDIIASFKNILTLEIEDGLVFHADAINYEIINEFNTYHGVRLSVPANLANIAQTVKIDIGFGDVIFPNATKLTFPRLLEQEGIELLAYSIETAIAEKFHAMVVMPQINSRMKDFYDVFHLLDHPSLNYEYLKMAIQETFKNRATYQDQNMILFEETYRTNIERNKIYETYLKKIGVNEFISFNIVMQKITKVIYPIYKTLNVKI
jgi:predicted nucleotidyltransferase component of viral defense system